MGRAVQVAPMKPVLQASGLKREKLTMMSMLCFQRHPLHVIPSFPRRSSRFRPTSCGIQ
jgi:hypothetical protein